jgi:hypothetical protein
MKLGKPNVCHASTGQKRRDGELKVVDIWIDSEFPSDIFHLKVVGRFKDTHGIFK